MQASLSNLPEDLLAHVLRFATGSARRDGGPPPAVPLSDFRYATVSTTFRRAFLRNLTSLALTTPGAKHLAALDWQPLRLCTSLRYIVIGSEAGLHDSHVIRLFNVLHRSGIRLRQADITVDRNITQSSVLCFASLFGSSVTHLDVRVPWVRRVRRRMYDVVNFPVYQLHPGPQIQIPALPPPQGVQLDQPQALNNQAPNNPALVHLGNHPVDPPPPLFALPPAPLPAPVPEIPPPHHLPMPLQIPVLPPPAIPAPVINIFDGVQMPNAAADFHEMANMIGVGHGHEHEILEFAAMLEGEQVQQIPPIPQYLDDAWVHDAFNMANAAENDAGQALLQMANEAVVEQNNGQLPPPVPADPPLFPVPHHINSSLYSSLSNDVFATVVSRLTSLQKLVIDRARHITNTGIMALANCTRLETLVLYGNHSINDIAMTSILRGMKKLKVLRLRDMVLIGDGTVSAVCSGYSRAKLEFLELTRVGRVTDPAVKRLVNSCENLKTVHIFDCPQISCEAASHLSCSLRLTDVIFKPQSRFPLMNRTSVHLSCASSTLRSLQLMGCMNLSLDGIMALGNLPGLRRLHLNGLAHVSQDVMRALGVFPRLDDLTLHGAMHLTDLGVKVLTAQRGHRFLYLSLLDSTKNLTDDALECVMTWCVSLRTLELHGVFRPCAIDRLHECIPNASITVESHYGRRHVQGTGGVWDPIRQEVPL